MATPTRRKGKGPWRQGIATPDATAAREANSPETIREAQNHQTYANVYMRNGLCSPCAYQNAYGHQLGWSLVRPPCDKCKPVVANFPVAKANGWRALSLHGWSTDVQLEKLLTE